MKAIVQDRYGGPEVLELGDIDQPAPEDNQLLVRVHAAGLDRGVWHVMTGLPYLVRIVVPSLGLRKPKVPVRGMDVAGRVEAVGSNVTRFRPGDAVFGWTDIQTRCASGLRIVRPVMRGSGVTGAHPLPLCDRLERVRLLAR
jgi:NADPH:quinone reductase-like Zn-dependent oxidoreductase